MTHYTLMGLEEFCTYDISVTAESNGMYSDSVSTSFTTMPSGTYSEYLYSHSNLKIFLTIAPSGAPENLKI